MLKEIVILSGKGGTGKTSITAAISNMLSQKQKIIIADCDTDATNLHQILQPTLIDKNDFYSGKIARIKQDTCTSCGKCVKVCRFSAIETFNHGEQTRINSKKCEGCGVCDLVCYPTRSIIFKDRLVGNIKTSQTPAGILVHGGLLPGGENSGHLVTAIRKKARDLANTENATTILIDGPPGIGCQSIASLTGVTEAILVSEPTVSAIHDTERIIELCKHFNIPATLTVNKADINAELSKKLHQLASKNNIKIAPSIPYDKEVINAQLKGESFILNKNTSASIALNNFFKTVF